MKVDQAINILFCADYQTDTTPPVLTFSVNPLISNGSITIQWHFNERATARCWAYGPTLIESAGCNGSWTGSSLREGQYTIYIEGRDLAGNIANPVQHIFDVDRTSPKVTITNMPHALSNEKTVHFQMNCDESCSMKCRVHEEPDNHTDFVTCSGSFYVSNLISDRTYFFEVIAWDPAGNIGKSVKYSWQTDFSPPVINCNAMLGRYFCTSNINSSVLGSPIVNDNIASKENISLTYRDNYQANSICMLQRQWTAIDTAGNSASCIQNVTFSSTLPLVFERFPDHAFVACGELTDMNEVFRQMFLVHSPCGLPTKISFIDDHPEKSNICGATLNRTWTVTDNCGKPGVHTQFIRILGVQKPITPTIGERGIDLHYTLRWSPYEGSSSYQVYIWKVGSMRSNISIRRTTSTYFTPQKPLDAGTKYFWQVEFILESVNKTNFFGPKWGFETRSFVDLIMKSIEVPPVAYSGTSFDVKWTVQNIGNLSTEARYWYDHVYLSFNNNFGTSRYVGYKMQWTILFPGDAYSSQMTVPLRHDDLGYAYLYVYTDKDNYITEINKGNNLLQSLRSVNVLLTPPPDLRVIGVKAPLRSFSGRSISVHWTVVNSGTGMTPSTESHWYDRIYLSNDQILDSSDVILETVANYQIMSPTEQYSKSQWVQIPEYITGNFWILVKTDSMNSVYERQNEENNVNASETSIYIMMQPIPDLSITEINIPEEVRTGNDLTIQWQVTNAGASTARGPWYDQVTLTQMIGTLSLKLGYNLQYNSINTSVGYHSSITTTIPPTLPSGAYLVTVDIDYDNRIFEFNLKTNNKRAKKILVRQALPNLSVDIFHMNLITADSINYVEVYAKILNTGQGKTYPLLNWIDSIDAINSESNYENNLARFAFSFHDGVFPGNYYEINKTLAISPELYGNFAFAITVDKFQNIEETNRADNRKVIGPRAVLLLAPDLFLSAPSLEHLEIQAGQSLLVSYMVKNIGHPIKGRIEWIDCVTLSTSIKDVRNLITFAEIIRTESSIQNGTYIGSITLNIPKNVVGEFYIHIVVNNGRLLYEGERFENNKIALPIMISRFPSPDLAVISTVIQQNINPELNRILVISWTVRNQGNSMTTEASWTDSILLSSEVQTTQFNFTVTGALEILGEYFMNRTIIIPESFIGNYSINVKTNSLEEIDELGETANNIGPLWTKVTFDEIPVAMLSGSIISVVPLNDTITTGRSVQIEYQVTNIGHARTAKQSWVDAIFASKKESQSFQDIKESGTILQSMTHIGGLEPGQLYTRKTVVSIPVDYNATSFFCMVADFDTSMDDVYAEEHTPDMLRNISISNSSQLILPPLKLPNLVPLIATLNNNSLRGGQPFTFEYHIQNIGNGQIKSSWYDSIYLSEDIELDSFDTKIITILRQAYIAVNGSTNFSTTVFLPFDLASKNYFLMICVDSRNEIFEEDENDNNLPISIYIQQSVSTDIAVSEVKAPSATVYGDSVTIEWTIINNGSREATGYKCDTVYFSKDNVLSIDDIQIADSQCNDISLAPYSNTSDVRIHTIREQTPLASAGSYKAIIRIRSNIFDSNQNNNILASNNSTCIDVKILSLGIIESFNITPGKDMAYRIANISADQTLVINLNTVDNEALLALYVKYGAPATKYDFDYRSDDSTVQNHTVVYPATKSGAFYLLVMYSGSPAMNYKSASLNLFAKLASFEILDAFPRTAAPLGNITMGIKGTVIPEDIQAFLFSKTINISASFVYYFSSVSVYATFDITRVTIGESFSLHLCSKTHSMNTTLSDALKTIQGAVGEFSITMSQPSPVLIGITNTVAIDIENIGDTDIQSPLLLVNVEGEGLIKFITDVKETYYMKNYIIFSPPVNGPGGIFAPHAYTRLLFEAKQTTLRATRIKITVFLVQPNNESFAGILDHESLFKPSNYEESTWKTIWTNFRALVGETTSTISKKLCEVSNQFSLAGRKVHLFKDYLNFMLEVSDGALGDKFVVWASDIDQISQENPKIQLALERYVSSKIGIRALAGPLGKGWILSYW
ncbi:hypothetical protein ACJMK2_033915 [Sinanodonta woodiana]|uniref:CARDB domain-containing protein n=1 Tax=Sinanodonta woodiana TaxID=1069815 RepID=A0ABD3WTP2_SINWO